MSQTRVPSPVSSPAEPRASLLAARPRLPPRAQLSAGAEAPGLRLATGEIVLLNPSAAAVLARCDGTRTAQELAAETRQCQATLEFLCVALRLGWLITRSAP